MQAKKSFGNRVDSVARSLEILGDRWIFLLLREAFFGIRYSDQFQSNLGIASNILSDRLKRLVDNGIMEKQRDTADGRRVQYRLTEKGLDLYSITLAFLQWGDKWLAGDKGPPIILHHKTCGHRLVPVMSCRHCGEVVKARDVRYEKK
jgi:DNA-binding HxlR family transcriptional regulator